MANKQVINLLDRFILLLRSEGINIDEAFLYGSYLSGTAKSDSDIDVLIVIEKEDDYTTGKIWSLTRKVDSRIEPLSVDKKRFNSSDSSPLIEFVKKSGLKIA